MNRRFRRFGYCMLAGALASGALVAYTATARHAQLAAAARPGHGPHPSVASVLVTVFIALTILTGVAIFTAVTAAVAVRRRQQARQLMRAYPGGDW
jgi:hypothetical protein